jgi:flagellar biosynthesis GTPase FlhF
VAKLPVVQEFKLKQAKLSKKLRVEFPCPHCAGDLVIQEAELTDQQESCPNCGQFFVMSPAASQQIKAHYDEQTRKQREQEQQAQLAAQEKEAARQEKEKRQEEEHAKAKSRKQELYEVSREKEDLERQRGKQIDAVFAQDEALIADINDAATWEHRYPNLSTYLGIVTFMNQLLVVVAGLACLGLAAQGGVSILLAIGAGLVLVVYYTGTMASIEFVNVICSIEQESVIARLERMQQAN